MSPPTVTVVVLNYNGRRHLEGCLPSLRSLDYPPDRLEVLLVDKGSDDGSPERASELLPGLRILQSEQHLGFARGNNLGARESTSDYIVFLNDDIVVERSFVRQLVDAVRSRPEAVSAGAKILNWDGSELDFAGGLADFAGHGTQIGIGEPYVEGAYAETGPILYACGGAMIVDRQVFLDVGGFDEDYFMYGEDVDLGWRLWLLGHEVVFAPEAVAHHRHHGTTRRASDRQRRVLYERNALATMFKNYSDENVGRMLAAALLTIGAGVGERAVAELGLDVAGFRLEAPRPLAPGTVEIDRGDAASLLALEDLVGLLPSLTEKRRAIQAQRVREDQEIVELFRPYTPYAPTATGHTRHAVGHALGVSELFEAAPRRVLVFSPDLLPYEGLPTVGSGLRAWGLGHGLRSRGHEVIFSMPRGALEATRLDVPESAEALAWSRMRELVERTEPDVVLICGWANVAALHQDPFLQVPVIVDQHGPHMLEREHQGYGTPATNAREKVEALRKADFFTCAGERQLGYFQTWLAEADWDEQEQRERSAAVPFSVSPELPLRSPGDELTFVYGGVWLPWQDPSPALLTLVDELNRRGAGRLHLFGGKHPWIDVHTGIFDSLMEELEQSDHVVQEGPVPHAELIRRYTRAHVAIDLMRRNPERELAFTSRTVEYLWCGLPVIYNDYSELSDLIREFDAGWTLDPEDEDALRAVVAEIFQDSACLARKSANAQRLVRERLTWDVTIEPIDRMVRQATIRRAPDLSAGTPRLNGGYSRLGWELAKARDAYRRGGISLVTRKSIGVTRRKIARRRASRRR